MASSCLQKSASTGVRNECRQPARFVSCHAFAFSRQLEVPPAFVIVPVAGGFGCFFDESISQQATERPVKVTRQQRLAPEPLLDFANQAPAVARLVHEGQE